MIDIDIPPYAFLWSWIAAILFGVLGGARLTRLITHDQYPPVRAVREWWIRRTWDDEFNREGRWGLLATCHWCAAPYVTAIVIASGYFSHMHWFWWLFWGWLGASYLTAIVVEHDEKD